MHPEPIKSERRLEPRTEADAPLGILCTNGEGQETRFQARLVDISLRGAKMRVPQKLPRSTVVYFYCEKFEIGGRGTVRYCHQHKQGYEIGLAFPSGTGWKGLQGADLRGLTAKVNGTPTAVNSPLDPSSV
jgi:PilZ domain